MSDDADKADFQQEMFREAAMKMRRQEGPLPTGKCLFCDEPLPMPHRWCDVDCREDWEKRAR